MIGELLIIQNPKTKRDVEEGKNELRVPKLIAKRARRENVDVKNLSFPIQAISLDTIQKQSSLMMSPVRPRLVRSSGDYNLNAISRNLSSVDLTRNIEPMRGIEPEPHIPTIALMRANLTDLARKLANFGIELLEKHGYRTDMQASKIAEDIRDQGGYLLDLTEGTPESIIELYNSPAIGVIPSLLNVQTAARLHNLLVEKTESEYESDVEVEEYTVPVVPPLPASVPEDAQPPSFIGARLMRATNGLRSHARYIGMFWSPKTTMGSGTPARPMDTGYLKSPMPKPETLRKMDSFFFEAGARARYDRDQTNMQMIAQREMTVFAVSTGHWLEHYEQESDETFIEMDLFEGIGETDMDLEIEMDLVLGRKNKDEF